MSRISNLTHVTTINRSLKPVHWTKLSSTRILCAREADLPDLFGHKTK